MDASTTTLIVALLRTHAGLSGEDMATRLGMSRAAVHKAVESLRKLGFSITASSSQGYRLESCPDVLCQEAVWPLLKNTALGRARWDHHASIPSTNSRAMELAREDAPHGTVVLAEHQTSGKGRRGRAFASPSGKGIYLSVVLRPPLSPRHAFRLTLCGALAVLDVLRDLGISSGLKWPNDVLVGGKKVCGILTELGADAERIHQAVIGIGLNVNTLPEDFPEDVQAIATSLAAAAGHAVDRVMVCAALLDALDRWYLATLADWPGVVAQARQRSLTLGRQVRVRDGNDVLEGLAKDLDEDGALVLETAGGVTRVVAGDVEHV